MKSKVLSIKTQLALIASLIFNILSNSSFGQNHVTLTNIPVSGLLNNAVAAAYENNYFIYSPGSGSTYSQTYNTDFRYTESKGKIELKIDRNSFGSNFTTFASAQLIEVKFDITYVSVDNNGSLSSDITLSDKVLSVSYDPSAGAKEKEIDLLIIPNAVYSRITVKEIKLNSMVLTPGLGSSSVPVILTNSIDVGIDVNFNSSGFNAGSSSLNHLITNADCQQNLSIGWNPYPGAKYYELEWMFVDNWVQNKNQYKYDFKNNSTRVRVDGNSYSIPLIFEQGYIIYRLRALGHSASDEWDLVMSPWTMLDRPTTTPGCQGPIDLTGSLPSGCSDRFVVINNGFEPGFNWQYTVSYIENAKNNAVIDYMDGALKGRQTVSMLNSENMAMVAQTIYDFWGRPAIKPIPVPDITGVASYCFRPDFNKSRATLNQYNWKDFDIDYSNNCTQSKTSEMDWQDINTSSGAAWYFSPSNSLITSGTAKSYEKFIPDAEGYPFVQTEYLGDNSGRIKRISGLGKDLRLKGVDDQSNSYSSSHETKYFYSKPQQAELDMLFGNDVGYASHYEKAITIDPNGKASVSYIDAYGRVIATALAGDPSQSPSYKPLSVNSNSKTITTKYNNTFVRKEDNSIITSEDVYFSSSSVHEIQYTMLPEILTQECMPAGVCFTCVYDLTISITNECGEQMLPGGIITRKVGNISPDIINNSCVAVQFTLANSPLLVNLPQGLYHIEKKLTVNKEAFEEYKKQYLASNECVKTFDEFLAEEEAKISSRECNYDCNTCQQDLAFYDGKISEYQQRIDNYSSNDPFSLEELINKKSELDKIRETTNQACQSLCKAPNTCDQLFAMILADVSPGGQYGLFKDQDGNLDETIPYSVYNNIDNHWRSPATDYKDAADKLSLIEIISNSPEQVSGASYFDALGNSWSGSGPKFIKPQGLKNLTDFMIYYQPSWAKSLATYHPEYTCWTSCQQTRSFYDYDNQMLSVSTFAEANSKGMLNPINSQMQGANPNNPSVYLGYMAATNTSDMDPVYNSTLNVGGSGSVLKVLIDEKLHNVITYNGVTYTAWQLMELYRAQIDNADGHCGDDLIWYYFRALYLNAKAEVLRQYFDATACHFQFETINSSVPKDRRFFMVLNVQDVVKLGLEQANQGLMNGNPQYIRDNIILPASTGEIVKKCAKNCNLYADDWMKKLSSCQNVDPNFTTGSTLWNSVKSKLIGVCIDGCDQDHPFGSSSVNPSNTGAAHTSFKDVLLDLGIFQLGVCDDIQINWPMPYGHSYFAYESADAVNCACDNSRFLPENIAKQQEKCPTYQPNGQPYEDCACDQTDQQKKQLLLSIKDIPDENKCNTCYTCVEVNDAVKKFNEQYGSVFSVNNATFPQAVTNYLNKYLNLNITFAEYTDFLSKCLELESQFPSTQTIWQQAINSPIGFSFQDIKGQNGLKFEKSPYIFETFNQDLWIAFNHPVEFKTMEEPTVAENSILASLENLEVNSIFASNSQQQLDNIKCNCKKILNAWKTAESSGRSFQDVMAQMYPGFSPISTADAMKLPCLQLFNGYTQGNAGNFTGSINDYNLNGLWTQSSENAINDELLTSNLDLLKDKSCSDDVDDSDQGDLAPMDDCACKKIIEYKAEYDALPPNSYTSFNEFMNQQKRVSSDPGFDKLYIECLRYYQTSLGDDAGGNPVQYDPNIPFNQDAKDHLKKDVGFWGYKVAKKILCNPTNPPGPGPCSITCNEIRNWLSAYLASHSIPSQYQTQFSLYREVEKVYMMSKEIVNNPDPIATSWLQDMINQFNSDFDSDPSFNRCKPFQYTFANLMDMLAPCMPPCPDLSCEALDIAVKDFITARIAANNNPNPVFIPESFNDINKSGEIMADELINFYNHSQGEYSQDRDWPQMTGFVNDFLSQMNTSFSNAPFCFRNFNVKFLADMLRACHPTSNVVGKNQSPCDVCFAYNTNINLNDLQAYLNQIAKGDEGQSNIGYNKLDMSNWKLYNPSSNSGINISSYYNSSLYQNGNDLPNLRYFTAGYPVPPQLFASVQDNNGHLFQYSLYFPGSQPWFHWGEIIKFRNIRIIDPQPCTVPKYFAMDVDIFMSKGMYKHFKSVTGISINNDVSVPIGDDNGYKYTITMTGTLVSELIATKVACPGPCYKLCNKPIWPKSDNQDICLASQQEWAYNNAKIRYDYYLKTKLEELENSYLNKCLSAQEVFTDKYTMEEYHYTLYYYDRAGMLIKTVPPQGVDLQFLSSTQVSNRISQTQAHRDNPAIAFQYTTHNLESFYRFNCMGDVLLSHHPDAGNTKFWYDKLGRVIASQNAEQYKRCNPISPNVKSIEICAYLKYDNLGRLIELGEKTLNYIQPVGCTGLALNPCLFSGNLSNLNSGFYQSGTNIQVTRTVFDNNDINYFVGLGLTNLRNQTAYSEYLEDGNTVNSGTYFSYDVLGNVKTSWQYIKGLDQFTGQEYKRIDYEYELVSGNTNKMWYQKGKIDQFCHKYTYDADNRLESVWTSRDAEIWQRDINYYYLKHGPKARNLIGESSIQGLDYSYSINGWLKNVNSDGLMAELDMGHDGAMGGVNSCKDAFGFSLNYFSGDYKPIDLTKRNLSQSAISGLTGSDVESNCRNIYNGNISAMVTTLPMKNNYQSSGLIQPVPMATVYQYDQLNRLAEVRVFENYSPITNTWGNNMISGLDQYSEQFEYDANGNILSAKRNGNLNGPTMEMDDLSYNYHKVGNRLQSNKLYSVDDDISLSGNYSNDFDDANSTFNSNPTTINTANDYGYDENGNLVRDNTQEIAEIKWNLSGKIILITRTSTSTKEDLEFGYDAFGRRLFKLVKPKETNGSIKPMKFWKKYWYIRDVVGNSIAIYIQDFEEISGDFTENLKLEEFSIYGSERIGVLKSEKILMKVNYTITGYNQNTGLIIGNGPSTSQTFASPPNVTEFISGNKSYELSNHLGNVLAVVQDRKLPVDDNVYLTPNVVDYYSPIYNSFGNYYAFGATLPEKQYIRTNNYKYGFNNQESESEIRDYYLFEYRIHDSRLGRFLSVDPLSNEYPWNSSYAFAENRVIDGIDLEGAEWQPINSKGENVALNSPEITDYKFVGWIYDPQTDSYIARAGTIDNVTLNGVTYSSGDNKINLPCTTANCYGVRDGKYGSISNGLGNSVKWVQRKGLIYTWGSYGKILSKDVNTGPVHLDYMDFYGAHFGVIARTYENFKLMQQVQLEFAPLISAKAQGTIEPVYFEWWLVGPSGGYAGHIYRTVQAKISARIASRQVINQSGKAILKNGFYEVNGMKFKDFYYIRLWNTGRGAPSLVAKEVLEGGANTAVRDAFKEGFYKYTYGGWELVYNPTTKEVFHLVRIK